MAFLPGGFPWPAASNTTDLNWHNQLYVGPAAGESASVHVLELLLFSKGVFWKSL
jgi:hypothetical protein